VNLQALQATVHRVLRGEVPVEDGAAALGCDARRLRIYREFVRGHVQTALEKNYEITRATLPAPTWEALVEAYFAAFPTAHWELNAAAEPFPAWLETRIGLHEGLHPFHCELAQFEWEEFAAYSNRAEVPAAVEAPTPNPTLSILQLAHPVAAFVQAWNAGERPAIPAPLPAPRLTFLFRHPRSGKVMYQDATDDLLFALKVTHEGLDPAAAARAIGAAPELGEQALAVAADVGIILRPT
jgi:hypothetical protein